jgi:predicted acylesterase/phospholipase RssA
MPALHMSQPRLFRTYAARENRSYDCSIWQAARATSAAPTFFKRIRIGEKGLEEEFIDSGLSCNNPIKQVLAETEAMFGSDRHVACIISIGCGQAGVIGLKSPDAFQKALPLDLIAVLRRIATDCESAAEEIEQRFQNIPKVYFRFNVDQGMQGVTLADGEKLGEVIQHTMQYIQKLVVGRKVNAAVKAIRGQRAVVKSAEISRWKLKCSCDQFSLFGSQMDTLYQFWIQLNQ